MPFKIFSKHFNKLPFVIIAPQKEDEKKNNNEILLARQMRESNIRTGEYDFEQTPRRKKKSTVPFLFDSATIDCDSLHNCVDVPLSH